MMIAWKIADAKENLESACEAMDALLSDLKSSDSAATEVIRQVEKAATDMKSNYAKMFPKSVMDAVDDILTGNDDESSDYGSEESSMSEGYEDLKCPSS
jgi:gamma-glutamyl phosphate reductase